MKLDLKVMWQSLQETIRNTVGKEFYGLRDLWNQHNDGVVSWDNVKTTNLIATNATITNGTIQNLNGTFIGLGRNRIINGDMVIDQRNAGSILTPTGGVRSYCVDRWFGFETAASGVLTLQQVTTFSPPTGFQNYLRVSVTTADATPTASKTYVIGQYIEGYNVRDFLLGTTNAKQFTFSFWVRSNLAGTFSAAFGNSGSARAYPFTYAINTANTWEQKTITATGDLTGTWDIINGIGFGVFFDMGCGSNLEGTANTWAAGPFYRITGSNRIIASTSNTFDVTGVQLELGSGASSFEYVPFPVQLFQCQRYCTVLAGSVNPHILVTGQAFSTTQADIPVRWPVTMRATPTVTIRNPTHFQLTTAAAALTSLTAGVASGANNQTCELDLTVAAVLVAGNATDLYSVNLDGTILADADF